MPDADTMRQYIADSMGDQVEAIGQAAGRYFNDIVPGMIAEHLASHRPVSIQVGERPAISVDRSHKALPDVLLMVAVGTSPFLVGPAGSGKTTLAEQVAKCMGRQFYTASRVTSEYKLVGFIDAQGRTVRTQFREAYEHGGVFLFDEVDASDPDALTAFNAALAGQLADFPDEDDDDLYRPPLYEHQMHVRVGWLRAALQALAKHSPNPATPLVVGEGK
jgi:hypothetical protein